MNSNRQTRLRFNGVTVALGVFLSSVAVASLSLFHFESQSLSPKSDAEGMHSINLLPVNSTEGQGIPESSSNNPNVLLLDSSGHTDLRNFCFPLNSDEWLNAGKLQRLGNFNESEASHDYVLNMILNHGRSLLANKSHSRMILQQSLCHRDSRFLSIDDNHGDSLDNPNNKTVNMWTLRFIYFATHIHQHMHATSEARLRQHRLSKCQHLIDSEAVGVYDFECPSAKFLVISMGRLGLGAVMRLGAVNGLIAGIATNRTVLIVNNAPSGPKFIRQPWLLASCPRMDIQCFYSPPSPCVLTNAELKNGKQLDRGETRSLFKKGVIPKHLADERVIFLDLVLRPQRTPPNFRPNLLRIIQTHLINPLLRDRPDDPRIPIFQKAALNVLHEEPSDGLYSYFGAVSKAHHALVFYAMRPSMHYSRELDKLTNMVFPADFDAELSLGLPIRASDKCGLESECIPFEKYMVLMGRLWTKRHAFQMKPDRNRNFDSAPISPQAFNVSIVVTSEAPAIRRAQQSYLEAEKHKMLPFSFRFINNNYDEMQGTGNPSRMLEKAKNSTMEKIMLSAISSLKLQLYAKFTVGNCCSNFHLLLFDFLKDGCGAAWDQTSECLQDNEDPEYRLCCQWSKSEECLAKQQQQ